MSVIINASTSSGLIQTADTSGTLVLQSNGTTQLTVSSTGTYGQLKAKTAQASTSGTSIDFTDIPSWVKRITIMCAGISFNATATPMVQLGTSGGIDSTSNYVGGAVQTVTGSTTESAANTIGFNIYCSNTAATTFNLTVTLCLVSSSTNQWICGISGGAGNTVSGASGGGIKTLTGTLDRVRVTSLAGTAAFDAGNINILYEG